MKLFHAKIQFLAHNRQATPLIFIIAFCGNSCLLWASRSAQ